MQPYLDLLADVRRNGRMKPTRARLLSTGRHVDALSVFGRQVRYDLAAGFPLATTKRVHFPSVAHELLWFLSGSTNVAYLKANGVSIWDEWATPGGELGPVYGKQWRAWEGKRWRPFPDDLGDKVFKGVWEAAEIDQVANLIRDVRAVKADPTHPAGRRLIVSAWNVADVPAMRLPPCHCLVQFMVDEDRLHCQLYQRSADLMLGVPFNVPSYALLTHMIARVTGLTPGEFVHTMGDAHIYANHLDQVDEQLTRAPRPLPALRLDPGVGGLDDFRYGHLAVVGYDPHPGLKAEVAV